MSRYLGNNKIELLAPAGTFEDFKLIIFGQADAVYFGGKKFNMRLLRSNYNFTNEEIAEAISIAHTLNKKVYITVNNLMNDEELTQVIAYLKFLESIKPDALIVQDLGLLKLIGELKLKIPIHSSVMMNVHNLETINKLSMLGVSRVVTSREISLENIKWMSGKTKMEFEYFIHGDMCVSHGSQCYLSAMLFGKSSNRGLCLKPCRWPYKIKNSPRQISETFYPLAVKDMCLYTHIPELIDSGVCSFKIEGRMRNSEYILMVSEIYGNAIDKYIENPSGYFVSSDYKTLLENKVRNFSTAYAFKIPGVTNIELDGKTEPKVFSLAVKEQEISKVRICEINEKLSSQVFSSEVPDLNVRVNDFKGFTLACDNGADAVIIPGDVFRPQIPFSKEEIRKAVNYKRGIKIYISLPRMMKERHFSELKALLPFYKSIGIYGILITNLGAIDELKNCEIKLFGDFSLNVYNSTAAQFYESEKLMRSTLSIEAPLNTLNAVLEKSGSKLEIIVQGASPAMYLQHCIYAALKNKTAEDFCECCKGEETLSLIDEKRESRQVFADQNCANHIIMASDTCYLPLLENLKGAGALRIEGQHYNADVLGKIVSIYRKAIDLGYSSKLLDELKCVTNRAQSFEALNFN